MPLEQSIQPLTPLVVEKPKKNPWLLISVVSGAVLLIVASIALFQMFKKTTVYEKMQKPIHIQTASPTPFPYSEMTIPSLRAREYKSQLNDLNLVSTNASYTSYLTSYDSDGFKVNAHLTIPRGESPPGGWPTIVFVHGYIPPTLYNTLENYSSYVDFLAKNGFVIFKIDLRGHGDSEGEPGGGYYGSDYIVDVLNARAALSNSDFVNSKNIGLWGHSMAGNIAMRSFTARPEIPAVVIWAGAVYTYEDQRKYGIDDNSYRPPTTSNTQRSKRQDLYEKVGSPSATSPFWKLVIPTNFLKDLKGAIQLNHAVDDTVVNVGYSRDLNALLDKTLVVHELNEYPSGGHNFTGSTFTQAMNNTVDFFKKHLNN